MEIIDFFKSDRQEYWFNEILQCTPDFNEVSALTHYIEGRNFHYHMGKGTVLLLTDGDRLVSFLSFSHRCSVIDESLYPWIGFVYTFPEYRGNRYAGRIISYCEDMAQENGISNIYVSTYDPGLFEKYGFTYMENRIDINRKESRIYCRSVNIEKPLEIS